MPRNLSRIAVILGTGALVSAGGVTAYAQSTTSGDAASSTSPSMGARPHKGGPKRLTDAQLQVVAGKLGVTVDALKAAMTATRPAKPAAGTKGAGFAADLAAALGVDVTKVTPILEANRPPRPAAGTAPAKPDDAKLVAALASGLDLDTATVQAALDKLHAAHGPAGRGAERDAALAKALGKTTAEVQAAFAAVRPAKTAA